MWLALLAVEALDRRLEGPAYRWRALQEVAQPKLRSRSRRRRGGQIRPIDLGDGLQRRDSVLWPGVGAQPRQRVAEDLRVALRAEREGAVVVFDHQPSILEAELQLAPLQDPAVLVAQDGEQDLPPQLGLGRGPVDVERAGVMGAASVLQDVVPPGIVVGPDTHVIGDDVDQQAHLPGRQRFVQARQVVVAADLGVDGGRVDHVVPVDAPWPGLQNGRRVEIGDAQRVPVVHQPERVAEGEVLGELDPVRRAGNDRGAGLHEPAAAGDAAFWRPESAASAASRSMVDASARSASTVALVR